MRASILASGYITYPNGNLITKPIEENIYIKYVIVRDYLKSHSNYFFSEEVDYLYKLASKNDNSIDTFDNKMRVIKLCKDLFNNKSILDWVELQKQNPLTSISHIDFIKDTLSYLFYDTKRKIEPSLWGRLIEPNLVNKDNLVDINRYLDEIIVEFSSTASLQMRDIVALWFKRPNGYIDLLSTLYIFYGSRDKIFTVS